MRSKVYAQSPDEFKKWLDKASHPTGTPAELGEYIWTTRGCNQCHTTDGPAGKAPTWKDVFMSKVTFKDGTTSTADEDYLHYVITNPNSKPIPGFDPMMPPTKGLLNEEDVRDVIEYIKTLSKYYHPIQMTSSRPANSADPLSQAR